MMNAATQMLKRAVELDNNKKYSEAKISYEEGIELLIKSVSTLPDETAKAQIRNKIAEYMKRGEELKQHIQKHKASGKFHETIKIKNGQIGCSYSTLFSKYIDEKLNCVTIQDAYIRSHHQLLNLLRFCELLVKRGKSLRNITVITGRDEIKPEEQSAKFEELTNSLKSVGVSLKVEFSDTIHDREILLDNGWIIKIGRGLDYFKSPKGRVSLGFCDFDLRECHETNIDIYVIQ